MKNKIASIESRIETMVAAETPAASIVQAAIAAEKKEKENREIEKVRAALRKVEANTEDFVIDLRAVRAAEKKAKANLRAALEAQAAFHATGDAAAYDAAIRKIRGF